MKSIRQKNRTKNTDRHIRDKISFDSQQKTDISSGNLMKEPKYLRYVIRAKHEEMQIMGQDSTTISLDKILTLKTDLS